MNQDKNIKVYDGVLACSRLLLADERNKKKLLDMFLGALQSEEWPLYAFCMTDDRVYFVLGCSGLNSLRKCLAGISGRFLSECREMLPHFVGVEPQIISGEMRELNSLQEIVGRCMQIHQIPLKKGYVERLEDYWWSSYITYMGYYDWGELDCRIVSMYFSADPCVARMRMQRFHQLHLSYT